MRRDLSVLMVGSLFALQVAACKGSPSPEGEEVIEPWPEIIDERPRVKPPCPRETPPNARVEIEGAVPGIFGVLELHLQGEEILIEGTIRGLPPGQHAIYVHELGLCEGPDYTTAGPHFNPDDTEHGAPFEAEHHAGDLGNLTTNAEGVAAFSFRSTDIGLGDGPNSIAGRAIVVHRGKDDFSTPDDDAGPGLACGIVVPTATDTAPPAALPAAEPSGRLR